MEQLKKLWRRWFPEKITRTPEEIETLRLEFKRRYYHFRQLIHANNRALDAMADIEQALQGKRPFGMTFVRSSCTTVSVSVYQMVRNINLLAADKYKELIGLFHQIQARIDPALAARNPTLDLRRTIPLTDIDKEMIDQVGAKMANLGEIRNHLKLRVPRGFVITAYAYHRFIEHNGLRMPINRLMQAVKGKDTETLHRLLEALNKLFLKAEIPRDLETDIMAAWQRFEADGGDEITTAIRSSAVGEDEMVSSFAGLHLSLLNIAKDRVLTAYKEVVASKYRLPAIDYRLRKGVRDKDMAMCVGCQEMIDALAGGVIYTHNPIDINDDTILINTVWGLPKTVVDGTGDSDLIAVSRQEPMKIIRENIGAKKDKFVRRPREGVHRANVPEDLRRRSSISPEQSISLAKLAVKMDQYYGTPLDIEWAIDQDGRIYILQCRPLQQMETAPTPPITDIKAGTASAEIIAAAGVTASPGTASGPVFRVDNDLDAEKFPAGTILLTRSALPRWTILLNKAAAVITEQGGFAGHLANVAREFKVPALFGVPDVLAHLKTGELITVDTVARRIFRGRIKALLKNKSEPRGFMEKSPVFQTLKQVSRHIIPLNLLNPDAPEFKPASCKTLQDITRFVHEKSVKEMFLFGKTHTFPERTGKQLYYHRPMKWWILNLDDGFKREVRGKYVKIKNIVSRPMLAFWEGFTAIPWEGPPAIDGRGLMSVMFRSTSNPALIVGRRSTYMNQNYFMISKNFLNLSSRLGYHFSTLEAYVTERRGENYIKFQFKGGAADYRRRLQRVLFIKDLLEEFEFRVEVSEDNLMARLDGRGPKFLIQHLIMLGYLSLHTRQVDMIMTNQMVVKHYRTKYQKDIDYLIHEHKPRFLVEDWAV